MACVLESMNDIKEYDFFNVLSSTFRESLPDIKGTGAISGDWL